MWSKSLNLVIGDLFRDFEIIEGRDFQIYNKETQSIFNVTNSNEIEQFA